MKTLTPVLVLVLACGCSTVDLTGADFSPPYSMSVSGVPVDRQLQPDEPLATSLQQWVQENQTGWSRSGVTYAPRVVVGNDNFSINFMTGGAVLNFKPDPGGDKWTQVVKKCDTGDLAFLNAIEGLYGKEAEQAPGAHPPGAEGTD